MSTPENQLKKEKNRVASIDLLRGLIMIIMALDHTREFFHFDSLIYSPVDLQRTTAGLFVTRWVTHLCAPAFIFLTGLSAYLVSQRKSLRETSIYLLTRGLWLILLQFTLIRFFWNFDPLFHFNTNTIISVIGICMICLSGLIHLNRKTILITGLVLICGHNLLDGITFEQGTAADVVWSFLHVSKNYNLGNGYIFGFKYPVIPWIGVIAVGYCFGPLFSAGYSSAARKKIIFSCGMMSVIFALLVRALNLYGDPIRWRSHADLATTAMSFFNLEKYPPSLLYLSLTLGISLLLLSFFESRKERLWEPLEIFGKTALFYYVLHILVIHLLSMAAVSIMGLSWKTMIFPGAVIDSSPELKGIYGFDLGQTYIIWTLVVILLYPICVSWHAFKNQHRMKWWISYV